MDDPSTHCIHEYDEKTACDIHSLQLLFFNKPLFLLNCKKPNEYFCTLIECRSHQFQKIVRNLPQNCQNSIRKFAMLER